MTTTTTKTADCKFAIISMSVLPIQRKWKALNENRSDLSLLATSKTSQRIRSQLLISIIIRKRIIIHLEILCVISSSQIVTHAFIVCEEDWISHEFHMSFVWNFEWILNEFHIILSLFRYKADKMSIIKSQINQIEWSPSPSQASQFWSNWNSHTSSRPLNAVCVDFSLQNITERNEEWTTMHTIWLITCFDSNWLELLRDEISKRSG